MGSQEKRVNVVFLITLPLFLLLLSYKLVLAFYPLTIEQGKVLHFLDGKEGLPLNYTDAEIAHLQDVTMVKGKMETAFYLLGIITVGIIIHFWKKKDQLQIMLRYSGMVTMSILIVLLVFILLNFNSLFTVFHQLFFPQGNWQFAADSSLIRVFPMEFFIKISLTIFGLTFILGSLFILLSIYLKNGHKNWRD